MASMRQINANAQNSLLSTGPKTYLGKYISSRNALKHGLTGRTLIMPDEEMDAVAEREAQWHGSFKPFEAFDVWLVGTVAVESIRVERCRWHEADARERTARCSADFWDEDRRLAAAVLADGLRRRPEVTVRKLRQTAQGLDLLIARWLELAAALEHSGDWDAPHRALALDLLGVAPDRRQGRTPLDAPEDGLTGPQWLARIVERHLGELRGLKPDLDAKDAAEQLSAMKGLPPSLDAEVKRLRRYERASMRELQWAVSCLKARKRGFPAAGDPSAPPVPPATLERQREQREQSRHHAEQFGAWAALASSGADHEFEDAEVLVADALHEEEPDDGFEDDLRDDDGAADELSGLLTEEVEGASPLSGGIGVPGLLKPVSLSSALRPKASGPGNRRARCAARSRARKG